MSKVLIKIINKIINKDLFELKGDLPKNYTLDDISSGYKIRRLQLYKKMQDIYKPFMTENLKKIVE